MFYLGEFFKILKKHPFVGATSLVLFAALISGVYFQDDIEKKISQASQLKKSYPYFNALVETNSSFSKIERKMKQLPGVIAVKKMGELNSASEIQNLQKNFGQDIIGSLAQLNYQKLRVEVTQGLQLKNQKLIQEYLVRLVGKEAVTLGGFKFPNISKSKIALLEWLNNWGLSASLIVLLSLWTLSFIYLLGSVRQHAFVVENFQRRQNVATYMVLMGYGVFGVVVASAINLGYGEIRLSSILALVLVLCLAGVSTLILRSRA